MQFLLDHLTATVIGTVIFFIVIFVTQSNREALADSTAFYVMIRQQEEFAESLTRDLQGVEELLDVEETNGRFRFRGRVGDDPALYTIVYERELVRQRDGVSYYRIKRLVDGQEVGGSADIVTQWKIEGRDRFGTPVNAPGGAAQVFVRFEAASLLGEKAKVKQTYWEASFFPPLLQ